MVINYIRLGIIPLYLFACLLLGGSGQGIWQNMVLQLAGIALIFWCAMSSSKEPLPKLASQLLPILAISLVVVSIQLVLIPFDLWSQIGPRGRLASGYLLLGIRPSFEPISLTPHAGLYSVFGLIPGIAMFCSLVRLKHCRAEWLAISMLAGTIAGILLGLFQVSSSSRVSSWYPYQQTNYGSAVGFFANANHMAILIVANIPFLAALAASAKLKNRNRNSSALLLASSIAIVLFIGLSLTGSLAGVGILLPVLVGSSLILFRSSWHMRLWILVGVVVLSIATVVVLQLNQIGAQIFSNQAVTSVVTRQEIFSTTWKAILDFFPFGSGLGSFEQVYHLYELPAQVTTTYVIHAHNDYLELALEMGLAGVLLIGAFLVCWATAAWRMFKPTGGGPYARAAAVASAGILIHSFVDYPLRTAAISAVFGMCLAVLANPEIAERKSSSEVGSGRRIHLG